MADTKFTKGPWECVGKILDGSIEYTELCSNDPEVWYWIGRLQMPDGSMTDDERSALLGAHRLIAAAPEMYEALQAAAEELDSLINHYRIVGFMGKVDALYPLVHQIDAAIAKAEGVQRG